jgi:hypothetical protein
MRTSRWMSGSAEGITPDIRFLRPTIEKWLREGGTKVTRSLLDLAYAREHMSKNPHDWFESQREEAPDIDPLSLLMLEQNESPAWVAKRLGNTSMWMLYQRYGKFIQNWAREAGARFVGALPQVTKRRAYENRPQTVGKNPACPGSGAGHGFRTRDLRLGKATLYQLS